LVRQFCLEQNWTAAGWPRSAQRVGVWPMDGPNNPRILSTRRIRKGRFAYLANHSSLPRRRKIKSYPTPTLPRRQGREQGANVEVILQESEQGAGIVIFLRTCEVP
ncbi:MAG: hypothetical protein ABIQ36_09975, partial [Rhodanobacter sp.]